MQTTPFPLQNVTVANHQFVDVSSIKELHASFTTGGSGGTFRLPNGTSGYAVTALKTLRIRALKILPRSAATGDIYICQTDNDVGVDSGTAFTNPSYLGGSAAMFINPPATIGVTFEVALNFTVAAGKYLSIRDSAGTARIHAIAYGYEE